MKKSVNGWTVPGNWSFARTFDEVKAAGFDCIELNVDGGAFDFANSHSLTLDIPASELMKIAALSEKYDLPVTSISTSLWGNRVCEDITAARELLRCQLTCADALGADGVLTVPGGIGKYSIADAYDRCIGAYRYLADLIDEFGIFTGVENVWNGFFASPFDMASFIDRVGHPLVGAYYDCGNVAVFSQSEYWIDILGSRIGKVHVKDFTRRGIYSGDWADLLEGNINWSAVIPALRKAGFDGALTAEVGLKDPPEYGLRNIRAALDKMIEL